MLKSHPADEPETLSGETLSTASQTRVTPEELSQALTAIEARKQAEASRLAGTIPISQVVSELNLDSTPEEILTEVQVQRACTLGWAYRDAEDAAEAVTAQLKGAKAAGFGGLLDLRHEEVRRSRALWTAAALAARAATDAARGAKEALDCHDRGEPWRRRTGVENGRFLIGAARAVRKRQDVPA